MANKRTPPPVISGSGDVAAILFRSLSGVQGYVHQVDHDPAGLHAKAIGFDVSSCEEETRS